MTSDAVRQLLRTRVREWGDQLRAATQMGVSPQYLSDVLRGKEPGPAILRALGLRRVVSYEPIRKGR